MHSQRPGRTRAKSQESPSIKLAMSRKRCRINSMPPCALWAPRVLLRRPLSGQWRCGLLAGEARRQNQETQGYRQYNGCGHGGAFVSSGSGVDTKERRACPRAGLAPRPGTRPAVRRVRDPAPGAGLFVGPVGAQRAAAEAADSRAPPLVTAGGLRRWWTSMSARQHPVAPADEVSFQAVMFTGEHHEADSALDSACNRTLAGHRWLQSYLQVLREKPLRVRVGRLRAGVVQIRQQRALELLAHSVRTSGDRRRSDPVVDLDRFVRPVGLVDRQGRVVGAWA